MRRDSEVRCRPRLTMMKVSGVASMNHHDGVIMLHVSHSSLSRRCRVKLVGSVTPPAQPGQIGLITPDTLTRENSGQSHLSSSLKLTGVYLHVNLDTQPTLEINQTKLWKSGLVFKEIEFFNNFDAFLYSPWMPKLKFIFQI